MLDNIDASLKYIHKKVLFPARIFCQMTCGWILPALEIISKVKCFYYELKQFTQNCISLKKV